MGIELPSISTLTLLGIATFVALVAGELISRLKLPALIGYLIVGALLGPSVLNLFSEDTVGHLDWVTKIALGFVAFKIGSELDISSLKGLGSGLVYVILSTSFGGCVVTIAAIYLLTGDVAMAIVFGAMAPASAPAGTVAVIEQYNTKGSLTKALFGVVGFDDGLAVLIFGFALAIAKSVLIGGPQTTVLHGLAEPLKEIVFSFGLGAGIGFAFSLLVHETKTGAESIILTFASVLLACGLAQRWDLSLILVNMVIGFVFVNTQTKRDIDRVLPHLEEVLGLVFLLFFLIAGAHLKVTALAALGTIGVVYVAARVTGKVGGAYLSGRVTNLEPKVSKYVGFGILSQAGVAIGFALIAKNEFTQIAAQHNLPQAESIGNTVLAVVTATTVVFEIIGPISAKFALTRAGEIPSDA